MQPASAGSESAVRLPVSSSALGRPFFFFRRFFPPAFPLSSHAPPSTTRCAAMRNLTQHQHCAPLCGEPTRWLAMEALALLMVMTCLLGLQHDGPPASRHAANQAWPL